MTAPQPVPWARSLTRWRQTSQAEARSAEAALLALSGTKVTCVDTRVGPRPEDFLHSLVCGPPAAPPLVFVPGYASAGGMLWRCLAGLATGHRVHAVDWLGTGLSGRPPPPRFHAEGHDEALDFFLDSFEAWRAAQGLERFALMGHSLGGLLASHYALRHPERVSHLLLVGPAGLAGKPEAAAQAPRTLLRRSLEAAWDAGVTPQSIARLMGPLARGRLAAYARLRFRQGDPLSAEETEALGHYIHHITVARGSGEFALPALLAPGAWARRAVGPLLHSLQVPLSLIYGHSDWMAWQAGAAVAARVAREAGVATSLQRIPQAGHLVFVDQPARFCAAVQAALAGTVPAVEEAEAASTASPVEALVA